MPFVFIAGFLVGAGLYHTTKEGQHERQPIE